MRCAFSVLVAAVMLAPVESRGNILNDYLGDWNYEEKWQSSADRFTSTFSITTRKTANGTIYSIAYESVKGKRVKAYEEWLYTNGSALLKSYENGRTDRAYTGSWLVRSGAIVFSYRLASDKREWFDGSLKRSTRDKWSGTGRASGGYTYTMLQQRVRASSVSKWLFEKKATAVVPRNYVWSAGKFDLGGNEKVPSYEFYPLKSRLASNSYGTFIFTSGDVSAMSLTTYVRDEVKPWFKKRGHKFVGGSEKIKQGQSWTADTTYSEKGINYRERMVVWPCKDGFVSGTVFGPVRDWSKPEFKEMLKVLDTVRIRQKR